jgi:formylglycine-generating enzyme required for sulfatase activity
VTDYGVATSNNSYKPTEDLGLGSDYPAYFVNWYEAIIYCNLKSIADNLTPAYYLVNSTGAEIGGTGNGRNPSTWLNTNVSGTNIAVFNGKYYYNSTATSNELDYKGETDTNGGIRFDQNANGWRLPTDVEWEYLARGGNLTATDQTTYSGSNTINEVAWYSENSGINGGSYNDGGKAHEVKTKLPNSLGLYDMSGNVFEWCWDWQINDSDNIDINTPYTGITSGINRVLRGGAWDSSDTYCAISYRRRYDRPLTRNRQVGFRVVRTLSE